MNAHSDKDIRVTAKRLRKLAKFLKKIPDRRIEMRDYVTSEGFQTINPEEVTSIKSDCGTSFCAAGWEAVRKPKIAKEYSDWDDFVLARFPALTVYPGSVHWNSHGDYCFWSGMSSKKSNVIARLKKTADKLESELSS